MRPRTWPETPPKRRRAARGATVSSSYLHLQDLPSKKQAHGPQKNHDAREYPAEGALLQRREIARLCQIEHEPERRGRYAEHHELGAPGSGLGPNDSRPPSHFTERRRRRIENLREVASDLPTDE